MFLIFEIEHVFPKIHLQPLNDSFFPIKFIFKFVEEWRISDPVRGRCPLSSIQYVSADMDYNLHFHLINTALWRNGGQPFDLPCATGVELAISACEFAYSYTIFTTRTNVSAKYGNSCELACQPRTWEVLSSIHWCS